VNNELLMFLRIEEEIEGKKGIKKGINEKKDIIINN
jgi:hypothetical protein